jgi:RNA polymerase sigma-70 factor (ECF subfamily)
MRGDSSRVRGKGGAPVPPLRAGRRKAELDPKITELEDGEAVRRILAGEEDLFEVLVRRYQARLVSHVTRMVGNRDDAMDLSQEIFLRVFQALDRFNPAYKFSTWLFRIAGNAAIDHLRKRRIRTVSLEPADPESAGAPFPPEQRSTGLDPYGELRNLQRGDAIARAIDDLPPDFRELIALRHFAGLSYEEIAAAKNMPLGTVKNKLFRARAVLKERLSGEQT